jgi:hypothetical protein
VAVVLVALAGGIVLAWASDQVSAAPATLITLVLFAVLAYGLVRLHAGPILRWAFKPRSTRPTTTSTTRRWSRSARDAGGGDLRRVVGVRAVYLGPAGAVHAGSCGGGRHGIGGNRSLKGEPDVRGSWHGSGTGA